MLSHAVTKSKMLSTLYLLLYVLLSCSVTHQPANGKNTESTQETVYSHLLMYLATGDKTGHRCWRLRNRHGLPAITETYINEVPTLLLNQPDLTKTDATSLEARGIKIRLPKLTVRYLYPPLSKANVSVKTT